MFSGPIMRRLLPIVLTFAGALAFGGCTMSGDPLASAFVAPGKYVLFQCDDIDREAKNVAARQKQLEALMAKSGTSAAGQLIGDASYGTELASMRGQMRDLREAARDKNCNFVPGAEPTPVTPALAPPSKPR